MNLGWRQAKRGRRSGAKPDNACDTSCGFAAISETIGNTRPTKGQASGASQGTKYKVPETDAPANVRVQWELQDLSLSPVSSLGPEIVDLGV